MHDLYNLKEMLIKELSDYGKDGGVSMTSLGTIDTLAHACKNVCKIIECEDGGGYSKGDHSYRGGYSNGYYDYGDEMGRSYRRGRGADGRFVSRDATEMSRKLREMADKATDEATRREIERIAEKVEYM